MNFLKPKKVFVVWETVYGGIDSIWYDKKEADAACETANMWNKRLYDSRYWHVVWEENIGQPKAR